MLALSGTLPFEGIVRWLVTPAYWARVLIAAGLVPVVRESTPAVRFLIAVLALVPFLLLDLAGGWAARRLRRPPRTQMSS